MVVSGSTLPTAVGSSPPSSPPIEAPALIWPTVPRAARGSNRSVTRAQNPEMSSAPSAAQCR